MFEDMAPSLAARLQATSYALGLDQSLREIADVVYDMDVAGATERDINRRIHAWMNTHGLGYAAWHEEVTEALGDLPIFGKLDLNKVWLAYGVEPWLQECIRSVAFTDEPTPFLPFACGIWFEDDTQDPPLLIAVLTPLSDPEVAAKQLKEKHRKMYGRRASGSPRKDEVFNARMLARHNAGMSYRDIAIQNLREECPDITGNPYRHKDKIKTEREKVAKAIPAAEKLWKERGLGSSIAD